MIYSTLQKTKLPCAYSHFVEKVDLPYIVYIGSGQDTFGADNTWTYRNNKYQVEYYFKIKNTAAEAAIEEALLAAGYRFTCSEDIYLDDEDVFVKYYYTS